MFSINLWTIEGDKPYINSFLSETHYTELGKYQILWLNKYKTIDLKHWRSVLVDNKPEWLYVGDWSPGPTKPYPLKCDGGYSQRQRNLESNRYLYWPT